MSLCEALMLLCFGVSWPVSIAKTLRTRQVAGKSPLFLAIVAAGYLCGIAHKLQFNRDWVTALYVINLLMVVFDLVLYYRYAEPPATRPTA